jgi:predicted DCC family thiol-disulfide oxidoreductase YuxK
VLDTKKNYLIFDADCGFCQKSVGVLKTITKDQIDYVASHSIEDGFYGIDKASTDSSIKFFEHKEKQIVLNNFEKIQKYEHHEIHEDAVIYHGAYAIFKALASNNLFKPVLFAYEYLPLVSVITEAVYRIIARNRMYISQAIGAEVCKIN